MKRLTITKHGVLSSNTFNILIIGKLKCYKRNETLYFYWN